MLDIPAQSSSELSSSIPPTEPTNEPTDRFAILDEAEKRVRDLLDSSSANKVLEQAESITTETETSEKEVEDVEEVAAQETKNTAQLEADNAAIVQAQQSIREAGEAQIPEPPVIGDSAESAPSEPRNIVSQEMAESFDIREQGRNEAADTAETQESPKTQQISDREAQSLVRDVSQFEEKKDSNDGILRVEDIESASRTINPISFTLTKEQDRREIGIRAAIEAHHEKIKAV